jgi:hypothetical protein
LVYLLSDNVKAYVFFVTCMSFANVSLPLALAFVSDITVEHERAKAFAFILAAAGIAFIVGPGVSTLLMASGGTRLVLAVVTLLQLLLPPYILLL